MSFIKEYCVKEIEQKGEIENIIGEYVTLKGNANNLTGECPFCNSKKKFSVSKQKNIWSCWSCGEKGVGYVNFVRKVKNLDYPSTLKLLADKLNITLEYEENYTPEPVANKTKQQIPAKMPKAKSKDDFRDIQLRESGLSNADQIYRKKGAIDGATVEMDRYQKGSINPDWTVDTTGDDMIMHYMDLFGNPMFYTRKNFKHPTPLIRVRYANPELHTDSNDRPMKYQSPYGSGTHVWINQTVRSMYENGVEIETLFIQEGEKKADKATKHGMISIGVMGIHNVANKKILPKEFELIIKRCDVKNVVFMVDGDYMDLSTNETAPIDYRPKSFLRAVSNFRDYFYGFNKEGISLGIYFGHVRMDQDQKGIDDLLVNNLKGKEAELMADIKKTLFEPTGEGKYCNIHKITNYDEYKIRKEFFHMETNEKFAEYHKESLMKRKVFKIGREMFKFSNTDDYPDLPENTLILAQPLSSKEQFWEEKKKKEGDDYVIVPKFKYAECIDFLEGRGFFKHKPNKESEFVYVKIEGSIVKQVDVNYIKEFMIYFARHVLQNRSLRELFGSGSSRYFSSEVFGQLDYKPLELHTSTVGTQYMYFKDNYWKITSEGIEENPITHLDGHVWENNIKNFKSKKMPQMFKIVENEGKYSIEFPNGIEYAKKCQFFMYMWNTSNFHWRKTKDGAAKGKGEPEDLTENETFEILMHFISKVCALGYMNHTFFNPSNAKAIIAMDGKLSEVGQSHGRSGKSLTGEAIHRLLPTFDIDGKQEDLTKDKFLLDGVDATTRAIFIDDVRPNFDVERLFTYITGKWKVNPKGSKSFSLTRETSPKIFITSNHAFNGEGGSFRDRLFFTAYSDYYSDTYKPVDDFGCLFFDEWPTEQWNMFYNLVGCCLQTLFTHGMVTPPMERLEKRRLRQQVGEAIIDWAETFYDANAEPSQNTGTVLTNLNKTVERSVVYKSFCEAFPSQQKWIDNRKFKTKLKQWAKYKGYEFNPGKADVRGDYKTAGVEYFIIADDNYKAEDAAPF